MRLNMSQMRKSRILIAEITFTFMVLFSSSTSFGQDDAIPYDRPRKLAKLTNPAIKESSGIAWSNVNKDIFWTHNDKGGQPRIFAFNFKGTHMDEYRIEGKNIDWEDICTYKTSREEVLVIADVGDNDVKRKSYMIYMFKEPKLKTKKKFGKITTLKGNKFEFTYEDGSHDCEAVAVDSSGGEILLVEKTKTNSCNVYKIQLPRKLQKEDTFVATKIATVGIPPVTAMDISPDNKRAILLTYGDAYEFTRKDKQTWAQVFSNKPRIVVMPYRRQGESICYGGDGKTLYLTGEGRPTPLWQVPLRPEQ